MAALSPLALVIGQSTARFVRGFIRAEAAMPRARRFTTVRVSHADGTRSCRMDRATNATMEVRVR